ncbi:hypothetical protein CTAM01_07357 [Colletotrichum tamarilloi]|uniref:Uncharacterized protein n=1 Tax=Colletotrichum tamarilloi TaxID=1209934 RepID=A0ABQ9R9N3_9PEZI|nr:uncharacterized protein CTAM01_07357 [Colletotrichum tamarilloi]KAK1498628.1 hypothetical protein CTAM01_07357 [Colletotrichum tamarilloi]
MRALSLSHLLVLASWAAFSFCAVLVKNSGEIDDTFRGVSQPMTSPPEKRSVLVEDSLKYDGAKGNDWVAPASSRKSVIYQIQKDSVTEDLASRNDDDDEFAPTETNPLCSLYGALQARLFSGRFCPLGLIRISGCDQTAYGGSEKLVKESWFTSRCCLR